MHYAIMVIFQIICGLGMSIVQIENSIGIDGYKPMFTLHWFISNNIIYTKGYK